jgi:hypothetical protein
MMTVGKVTCSFNSVCNLMAALRRERWPREQQETQVNGGGVQCVGGSLEFDTEKFAGVAQGSLTDDGVGKVGMDASVAFFVGLG